MIFPNIMPASPARLRSLLTLVPRDRGRDEREFLPAALEIIETPASPAGRAIGVVIVLAALTALAWSSIGQVDIITTAPGRIVPVGRNKIIQPFAAGIVQEIAINDGDHVDAGQTLIVLDPTAASADVERLSQDLLDDELDRSRLEGLRAVLRSGGAPVMLDVPAAGSAEERAATAAQMEAQALEEAGKVAGIDQQIAEKLSEAKQAVANIARVRTDRPYLAQVAGMRTTLLREQVGSRLDWLNAEQQLADTGPSLDQGKAEQQSALADVAALRQQRAETQAEYATTVLRDLEQAEQKIGETKQDLIKAKQLLALTTLRAPIAGTVQQLAVHTIGGVVNPAQALLTIVPDQQRLMVEASVKNPDIGFVHIGQDVRVKIGAFDFTRFGAIDGKVVSISRDVVDLTPNAPPGNDGYAMGADPTQSPPTGLNGLDAAPQEPEYVVHISLAGTTIMTDAGLENLLPGMGVTADIQTGRRRVISYLLSPFAHQIDEAGHER